MFSHISPSGRVNQVKKVESEVAEDKDVRSNIPSRIKCLSTLDVTMAGALKVKRPTIVFTNQQGPSRQKKDFEGEEQVSSNHISMQEISNSDSDDEIETGEAP